MKGITRLRNRLRGPGGVIELLGVAVPLFVSNACETVMLFTDRLFLARVGPAQVSASMGGGLTAFMFMTFFLGLTGYANALVAQYYGAGRRERVARVVAQALWISLAAYPIILCCIPLGRRLFDVMGVASAQQIYQRPYFTILMCGSLLGLLRHSVSAHFSGIGRTRTIMAAAAVMMAVNIGANYVLIFGKLGLPALGIRGAAFGTLLGSFAGLLTLGGVYFGRRNRRAYGTVAGLRWDGPVLRRLLRFGYPAGVEFCLNMVAFNLLVMTFHSYGVEVALAVTAAFSWDMVSFIPLIGCNVAVTSLVGRYVGASRHDIAHRATMSALGAVGLYAAVIVVVFSLFPQALAGVFRPSGDDAVFARALPLAAFMVRLVSVYVFADAVGLVFSGALRGAGDTLMTMVISVSSHWLLTLSGLILVRGLHAPPRVAWSVVVVLVWSIGLAFCARYRTGRWRHIAVIERAAPIPPPESVP